MAKRQRDSAAHLIPDRLTLAALRKAAAGCRACELWKDGTQTVFGEGPPNADLMLRGELVASSLAPVVMATVHPSSLLRERDDETRHREIGRFVDDLRKVARTLPAPREI